MLCLRRCSYLIKVTIILLVSRSSIGFPTWSTEVENPIFRGSSKGFPDWSIEEENPLFRDSLTGDLTLDDDLYNLLKKALALKFGPGNYMGHIDYISGLKSEDLSNRVMSPPSLDPANFKLLDEMDDPKYEQFNFDNKDMATKRSNLHSICQKGNVFGNWLNKLCNERRSGK